MIDWLADSNLWLRSSQPEHPMYLPATRAIKTVLVADEIYLVPQVVNEFWRVVTSPLDKERGGFGWDVATAHLKVLHLELDFPMKYDSMDVYERWRVLVLSLGLTGIKVHDARLVAAMLAHGLTHILTFNVKDFLRYVPLGITVVHPNDI